MSAFILYIVIGSIVLARLYGTESIYILRTPERVLAEICIWPILLIRWTLSKL